MLACVEWRFWLGALSNEGGRGQRNREEIGVGATWPLVRPDRQNRHATQATKMSNPHPMPCLPPPPPALIGALCLLCAFETLFVAELNVKKTISIGNP